MSAVFIPTVAVFFYAYFILVAIFCLLSLVIIYHLLRFGFLSFTNIFIIMAYAAISAVLIAVSLNVIYGLDWSIQIFDPAVLGGFSSTAGSLNSF